MCPYCAMNAWWVVVGAVSTSGAAVVVARSWIGKPVASLQRDLGQNQDVPEEKTS